MSVDWENLFWACQSAVLPSRRPPIEPVNWYRWGPKARTGGGTDLAWRPDMVTVLSATVVGMGGLSGMLGRGL